MTDQRWTALPPQSRTLLWTMRHMLVCWPGCTSVQAALISALDEEAQEAEQLIRALILAITHRAHRRIEFGNPACAHLLSDEMLLLDAVGLDGAEPAPDELCRLTGCPGALTLAPLTVELRRVFARATTPCLDALPM